MQSDFRASEPAEALEPHGAPPNSQMFSDINPDALEGWGTGRKAEGSGGLTRPREAGRGQVAVSDGELEAEALG